MTRHPVRYHCKLSQVSSLQKAEQPENKLPTTSGSHRKQGNSRKTCTSASLTTQKPLTVWITTNCGKFLDRNKSHFPFQIIYNSETLCQTIQYIEINLLELGSFNLTWKEQSGVGNSELEAIVP